MACATILFVGFLELLIRVMRFLVRRDAAVHNRCLGGPQEIALLDFMNARTICRLSNRSGISFLGASTLHVIEFRRTRAAKSGLLFGARADFGSRCPLTIRRRFRWLVSIFEIVVPFDGIFFLGFSIGGVGSIITWRSLRLLLRLNKYILAHESFSLWRATIYSILMSIIVVWRHHIWLLQCWWRRLVVGATLCLCDVIIRRAVARPTICRHRIKISRLPHLRQVTLAWSTFFICHSLLEGATNIASLCQRRTTARHLVWFFFYGG